MNRDGLPIPTFEIGRVLRRVGVDEVLCGGDILTAAA
jgi:hypothetical protein